MAVTLNNPLVLIGGTVLGFGFKLSVNRINKELLLCAEIEALFWQGCKTWQLS